MKNFLHLLTSVLLLVFFTTAQGQITLNSTGGTGAPSSTYPSLAAAITAINDGVTHTGFIICNVPSGYSEVAPPGGFVVTASGDPVNPIIFQKSGSGPNPQLFASASQPVGSLHDAVFEILGGDYITIDGFDFLENPANTTTTVASNNMTEWGIALSYASPTNGCQNITIQNCLIDLDRTYPNTFGIYANSTHAATTPTTSATATGATGGNSNLLIRGNNIQDVNFGIVIVGPTAAADHQTNIVIGGNTPPDGNIITNYGTNGTFSAYANIGTGQVSGILIRNSKDFAIKNNIITSSTGGLTSGTLNGIFVQGASNAPTGAFTNEIIRNLMNLQSGAASGQIIGINYPSGSSSATSSLQITTNTFTNFGNSVASSGSITGILCQSQNFSTIINGNIFNGLNTNTTGSVQLINASYTLPAGGSKTISNNSIVGGFTKTGSGGTVTFYFDNAVSPANTTDNIVGNSVSGVNLTGATSFVGIQDTNGGAPNKNITNNIVENISNSTASGTVSCVAYNINFDGGTTNVVGNIARNISWGNSSGAVQGIFLGTSGSGGALTTNVNDNLIHNLTTNGSGAVSGIVVGHSAGMTRNIFNNKIHSLANLSAFTGSGLVNGILFNGASANFTGRAYNNVIGNLGAPNANSPDAIRGISLPASPTTSSITLNYNTIFLNASSSGANFGTSGVFHAANATATTNTLNMINNLIINKSTANGTGLTVALRRSGTALANYGSVDNNIYFAGLPGPANMLYSDGTNNFSALVAFQTHVAPDDAASQTEDTSAFFISVSPPATDYCRIAPASITYAESGGVAIPGITTDFWNVTRPFPAPVNGGVAVDIGASEFDGIPVGLGVEELDLVSNLIVYPNPVSDYLHLVSNEEVKYAYVFNLNGQLVMQSPIVNDLLDMSTLASGQYLVQLIYQNSKASTVKVIKR